MELSHKKIWDISINRDKDVFDVNRLLWSQDRYLIPRLNSVKSKINFNEIPSVGVTHTLEECALERASEILKLDHQEIMVLFSGGVDSSMAAVSLVVQNNDRKKIVIGYTESTIKYTDVNFIKWLVDAGCKFIYITHDSLREYVKNGGFFVTGTHGDNLVLSDAVGYGGKLIEPIWNMSPEDFLETISGRQNGDKLLNYYGHLFDEMPLELTAPNMLWWTGFCFYWHRDSFYMTIHTDIGQPEVTHTHFFNSVPFQRWMMQDASIRCGRTIGDHKYQVINAVNNIANDNFHIKQKTDGWDDVLDSCSSVEAIISIDHNWNIKKHNMINFKRLI